jgi:hypothetical protein
MTLCVQNLTRIHGSDGVNIEINLND